MAAGKKSGLGKGLDALFADNKSEDVVVSTIRISEIEPNRDQPRKDFDENALAELADSIREHGVLQPLVVRPLSSGSYQLVAGERRWRASRMAGLTEVPVVVKELTDTQCMEIALIENLQREDLNPIEEALGYRTLMDQHHFTQEELSKRIGKSRPTIANAIRLLKLPDRVVRLVQNGDISSGHARALLSFEDEEIILKLAGEIVKKGLSVREVEKLAQKYGQKEKLKVTQKKDTFYDEMQIALTHELGRKIKINVSKGDKGTLQIDFYNKEELADIAERLTGEHAEF
ncbi:ParB/RepB/Spo0J family partition protein [Candidatus Soleaferrea massiliensis]|uniref:ParB/RepB/Spo0J family partition protein n=1 Tax=Candidatus Soleaferrea massiliensis TaxID=1470354 RepID=UPI00058F189A|nr:ParB/RepB/Spo0J family partition protein [Candidatus Soleaferrea massiliensis]